MSILGCKTTKGVNCSFPFKFRGYNYTVCTNDWMNKTKHWCAIETDTNRSLVSWGYCEDSCKKESTGTTTTHPPNKFLDQFKL